MNTATTHYLAHVFGWTLLHLCWQATVIALLLACALSLLGKRSARVRYVVSCAALMLVVVTLVVTFQRVAVRSQYLLVSKAVAATTIDASPGEVLRITPLQLDSLSQSIEPALPYLLAVWSAGFLFCIARLNLGLVLARRLATHAALPVADEHMRVFRSLMRRLGMTQPVKLLRSASVQVPVVIGWLRPVVLLPITALAGLSSTQIEAILAHELAHIRRHDYLVSVLQTIVESLLFYHPAVWWMSRQIRRERELCCDDIAVSITGAPVTYARALYHLAEFRTASPAVTLSANGGLLTMRIKRLLRPTEVSTTQPTTALVALALLLVLAGIGFGTAQAERPMPSAMIARLLHTSQQPISTIATQTPAMLAGVTPPTLTIHASNTLAAADPMSLCPIQVTGNQRLPKESILARLSMHTGDPYDSAAAARDFNTLWATGYFTDVRIEKEQAATCTQLTIDVREKSTVTAPSADGKKPLAISGGVVAGNILTKVRPEYPPDAKAAHIQGEVVLKAVISKEGNITNLQVVSGPVELQKSAIDAVQQWTYKPYLLNGQPTEVQTNITVNYHVADPTPAAAAPCTSETADCVMPKLVYAPQPEFPSDARAKRISKEVIVHLLVDEHGNAQDVAVDQSVGYGFDEKAIEAVRGYKFRPAMRNAMPVTAELKVAVNFQAF